MLQTVKTIFDTFGAVVFVPVMIFIIALILRVKPSRAFISALNAGVGLTGFTLLLNSYTPIISKVIQKMVNDTGVNKPVFDIGWQGASLVAYSTHAGMVYLVVALILQTVLFLIHWTDVFQPSDLWNNYSYMVWGSMCFFVTKNMWLSLALMILLNMYSLLLSDVVAQRWSNYYGYPRCTIIALHNIEPAAFGIVMDPIWNFLRVNKIKLSPQYMQKKFGFLGEPISLGFFLGLLIGILGNFKHLGEMAAWGQTTTVAIATAAIMVIFPKIAGIFAQAFAPLSQAASRSIRKNSKNNKDEKDKKPRLWFLGVNDAVGYGEPATMMTGIILMPIMVALAIILPGNKVIPIVDLLAIPYWIEGLIALSNGNMVKTMLNGVIWFSLSLYMCTATAPLFTHIASSGVGVAIPSAALMVTSFNILGKPLFGLVFYAFLSRNPLWIGLTVIIYLVLWLLWIKNKESFRDYLERAAAKNATSQGAKVSA
jgi:PTS system galactitol-specific IIC component